MVGIMSKERNHRIEAFVGWYMVCPSCSNKMNEFVNAARKEFGKCPKCSRTSSKEFLIGYWTAMDEKLSNVECPEDYKEYCR